MLQLSEMIVNNSPFLMPSLRPNIDDELEPMLIGLTSEVKSESNEQAETNRLNKVKVNLDASRFKPVPVQSYAVLNCHELKM